VVSRGELWWVDFGSPTGSAPGYRRPALVVSSDRFNNSRIATIVVAAVTSNLRLGGAPGNVVLDAGTGGLPGDSVVNVSQLITVDRSIVSDRIGRLPGRVVASVDAGLRLVLGLR
jgi:mRNA interferase MazF